MSTVFIGGSRRLGRLNQVVRESVDDGLLPEQADGSHPPGCFAACGPAPEWNRTALESELAKADGAAVASKERIMPAILRAKPFLFPAFCKACGRCIEACPKDCIRPGTEIDQTSGLTPVVLDLEACNACGLCLSACPEPHGLLPRPSERACAELSVPATVQS
jgi:NAD-dependent dihydropyrimidine dehydrogenase PreA subunit